MNIERSDEHPEVTNKQRQAEEQLSIYRKDIESIREKKQIAQRENYELKKELQKASQSTKQKDEFQGALQEREREIATLKKTVKSAEQKLDQLRMEKETQKRTFKETIKELEKKAKPPQQTMEDEFNEMRQIIQREREKAKEEKQTIRKELDRLTKEFEERQKKLKDSVEKARRQKKENEETSKKMSDASSKKYDMMEAKYTQKIKEDNDLIEQIDIQLHELGKKEKKYEALAKSYEEKNKKQTE